MLLHQLPPNKLKKLFAHQHQKQPEIQAAFFSSGFFQAGALPLISSTLPLF